MISPIYTGLFISGTMAMNMNSRSRLQTYTCTQGCEAPIEPLLNGHPTEQMTCMSHAHSNHTAEESFGHTSPDGHHNIGKRLSLINLTKQIFFWPFSNTVLILFQC